MKHIKFFHSPKCGFCVETLPNVHEAIDKGYDVQTINTLKLSKIADMFNIERIPTFILFEDGEEIERWVGKTTTETIINKLQ